jgi:hypothetical protein
MTADDGYLIVAVCGLVLTRAGFAGLTTAYMDPKATGQRWQFVQSGGDWIILEVGGDEGSLVSDVDGNLSLAFANEQVPHWNIAVVDSGLSFDALQDLLTPGFGIIDSIDRSLLAGASTAYAFRPTFDYDRNLNVLGDGPYNPGNPVAAYRGWSGGANNEIWLVLATAGQPRPNLPGG